MFRHVYHMSRRMVAELPVWEREALLVNGRRLIGLDRDSDESLSESDVRSIVLTPTRGVPGDGEDV